MKHTTGNKSYKAQGLCFVHAYAFNLNTEITIVRCFEWIKNSVHVNKNQITKTVLNSNGDS